MPSRLDKLNGLRLTTNDAYQFLVQEAPKRPVKVPEIGCPIKPLSWANWKVLNSLHSAGHLTCIMLYATATIGSGLAGTAIPLFLRRCDDSEALRFDVVGPGSDPDSALVSFHYHELENPVLKNGPDWHKQMIRNGVLVIDGIRTIVQIALFMSLPIDMTAAELE